MRRQNEQVRLIVSSISWSISFCYAPECTKACNIKFVWMVPDVAGRTRKGEDSQVEYSKLLVSFYFLIAKNMSKGNALVFEFLEWITEMTLGNYGNCSFFFLSACYWYKYVICQFICGSGCLVCQWCSLVTRLWVRAQVALGGPFSIKQFPNLSFAFTHCSDPCRSASWQINNKTLVYLQGLLAHCRWPADPLR